MAWGRLDPIRPRWVLQTFCQALLEAWGQWIYPDPAEDWGMIIGSWRHGDNKSPSNQRVAMTKFRGRYGYGHPSHNRNPYNGNTNCYWWMDDRPPTCICNPTFDPWHMWKTLNKHGTRLPMIPTKWFCRKFTWHSICLNLANSLIFYLTFPSSLVSSDALSCIIHSDIF